MMCSGKDVGKSEVEDYGLSRIIAADLPHTDVLRPVPYLAKTRSTQRFEFVLLGGPMIQQMLCM
jgi:hypothetical protein